MAVKGRISEVENQIPPLTRDARTALQQAAQANTKTDEIENRLWRDNVHIVGLPERSHSIYRAMAAKNICQGGLPLIVCG